MRSRRNDRVSVNGVSERELNVPEFVGTLGPDPRKPLSVDRPGSLTTWKGLGCCSIRGYLMTIVGVGREGLTMNPSHLVDFQHAWRHLRINIILEDSIERRHITPSDLWVVDTTRESIFLVFSLTDFAHLVLNPLHQPAPETQLALDILIQCRLETILPKIVEQGQKRGPLQTTQNTSSIIRSPPISSNKSQLSSEFSEHEIYTKIHPGAFHFSF
jgi:hypothetical protein